jgi:hypothetical protein
MADEITASCSLQFAKGNAAPPRVRSNDFKITVTGTDYTHKTQNVGTSAEALNLGEIGTPGMMWAHNLDGTNFVEFGYDDGGFKPTVKLLAGDYCLFQHTQAAPQVKADTGAVEIEYFLVEA